MQLARIVQVVEPQLPDFSAFTFHVVAPFPRWAPPTSEYTFSDSRHRYFHLRICTLTPTIFAGNVEEEMKNIYEKNVHLVGDTKMLPWIFYPDRFIHFLGLM